MAEVDVSELDEVHDLYRVDPSEFVEARAALVKQLRADKRVDEARAVVKLRKPSAPSWALDQVAHDEPELIEAALAAGNALRAATAETLEGDASKLRAATDAEGKAAAAVIDAAGAHLALTPDLRERMGATLRAAISDDHVRALLVAGLLAADHEPPPMGFAAPSEPAAHDAPKPAKKAPAERGAAKAQLAASPDADEAPGRSGRKIRRVGTPSSTKRTPVDEVDAKRKAKEVERLQAEDVERRRAEAEAEKERKKQQAALDAAAKKARTAADRLDEKAKKAEDAAQAAAEAAAAARTDADAAHVEAAQAESAAAAGPLGTGSGSAPEPPRSSSGARARSGSGPAIRTRPKASRRR